MGSNHRTALIVEDDRDFSHILRRLLDPWKLQVDEATSVASALELISRRDYDFYAIDLHLADGDSGELLSSLAARGEPTISRCIVVTSHPEVASFYTPFPIVSKMKLSSLSLHLFRILGGPFGVRIEAEKRPHDAETGTIRSEHKLKTD